MFRSRSPWPYVVLGAIFVGFASLAYVLPVGSILAAVAGNVGVVALIGALFQLFRDQAAHDKQVWLNRDDQQFQVGVTSHMSNVVFDKHVVFCEAYMAKVREAVESLFRNHASGDSVGHANELYAIRVEHSTWVTTAMSAKLSKFEDALRHMGALALFIKETTNSPAYGEQRSKAIETVYAEFERILPHLFSKPAEEGVGLESIEARVREMLGIEQLVELRTALIRRAHADANANEKSDLER